MPLNSHELVSVLICADTASTAMDLSQGIIVFVSLRFVEHDIVAKSFPAIDLFFSAQRKNRSSTLVGEPIGADLVEAPKK